MNRKQQLLEEFKLRRLIRKALRLKEAKKQIKEKKQLTEERDLRQVIRHLLSEGDVDADTNPAPMGSTALSALADAFNQILPVLKTGLRKLKRPEERQSYRAHVLQKFSDMFRNFEGLDAKEAGAIGESDLNEQEEDNKLTISVDDPDRIMPSDGKEDDRFKEAPAPQLEPDDKDIENLAIETEDATGARFAFNTINNSNIEKLLSDTRKLLPRDEDKQEYKEYAMYNVDLWLLTYEKELSDELGGAPAFDQVVTEKPAGAQISGAAQEFEGAGDLDIDLEDDEDPNADLGGLDDELPDLEGLEDEDLEGEDEDALFQEDLEEILMMETFNVGE
jgi:hypothetical protein